MIRVLTALVRALQGRSTISPTSGDIPAFRAAPTCSLPPLLRQDGSTAGSQLLRQESAGGRSAGRADSAGSATELWVERALGVLAATNKERVELQRAIIEAEDGIVRCEHCTTASPEQTTGCHCGGSYLRQKLALSGDDWGLCRVCATGSCGADLAALVSQARRLTGISAGIRGRRQGTVGASSALALIVFQHLLVAFDHLLLYSQSWCPCRVSCAVAGCTQAACAGTAA